MSNRSLIKGSDFSELFKKMENVTEFKENLDDISKTWDQLILLSQLGATGIDMTHTKGNFNDLTKELITHLESETLKKVTGEMESKAQVAVDIVIRNLFERTADIGFLATDDDIRGYLLNIPAIFEKIETHKNDTDDTKYRIAKKEHKEMLGRMVERFNEYVAKYSVYYDIVLFDNSGKIVAKLDKTNLIMQSSDEILDIAKVTTEDYIETYKYHDFLPDHEKSLVYTYKVTKTNDSNEIIGYLSLCFKFEDEMEGIFSNLINKTNKETLLLLDKENNVIASSDKFHIPINAKLETNTSRPFILTQFAGRDYIAKTCKTNGYEGFFGLGWQGHILIPLDSAFKNFISDINIEKKILSSIMQNEDLFTKELLNIPQKASDIQDELDRAVWNGNVSQMDSTSSNADFARSILREVRQTGEKTKKAFNDSIEKLNQTIITSLLNNVTFLASLSIDIMDRNLYERANDCRWWALTSTFKEVLEKKFELTGEDKEKLTSILKYINELYTVYTNLFIYDTTGTILAVSNESQKNLVGTKLASSWVKTTLGLKDSSKYSVSEFEESFLYGSNYTYIYGAAIKDMVNQGILGGIGIVFDSTDQFKAMLKDALPQTNGEINKGVFSLFVEKQSRKVVNCSDGLFEIGDIFSIDEEFFTLSNGDSLSKVIELNKKYYVVGAKCSNGYREYKSAQDEYKNEILAFVLVEAGEICEIKEEEIEKPDNYYNYQIGAKDNVDEIATFYVGSKWLGVKADEIVEAISVENLETPLSTDTTHHFKGTVSYKDFIISVLDISKFVKNSETSQNQKEIVIVKYKGSVGDHTIGILVDYLGEIMKIPKHYIRPFEKHLIGGGMLGESIVQPPEDVKSKQLLTLLNISKIGELNEEM